MRGHYTSKLRGRLLAAAGIVALTPAAAAAQTDAAPTISEIIVTAQRRSERLLEVPLSVTAVNQEALTAAGVTSTRELMMVTPGLRLEAGGAYVQPAIRGITTNQTVATAESNIATYVDGVYQQTMAAALYDLPDIEQVEVLKGPQGTLFGRNATGGAILINTIKPNLTQATGMISGTYGRFDNRILKGYVTAPLIEDKLAVSFTTYIEHMDGYKKFLPTGGRTGHLDTQLFRGKIRFLPWEGADFTLTGLYTDRRDYTAVKNTNWRGNNALASRVPPALLASRPLEFSADTDPFANSKQKSVSLVGDIELGPGVLTTTTAYNKNYGVFSSDSDNTILPLSYIYIPYYTKAFQQELVYATNQLGRWHATGGLFYFNSKGGFTPLNVNNFAQAIYTRDKAESYAGFGELTYDITDRLRLTGGLRYSHDTQTAYAALRLNTPAPPPTLPRIGKKSWDAWTPRVSLSYKVSDQTNLYATYSQGFKSGVFNTVAFQATPVNPEKVKAYEVGIKSNALDNFRFDLAGFYYDYKDLQQPAIITVGAAFTQELRNAATAEVYGAEANATWRLTPEFTLSGGMTWLHARYKSFPSAVVNVPTGVGGNRTVPLDASGNVMIRSPDFSANLTARYVTDTSIGRFDAAGTIFYSSKLYFEVGNRVVQPSYAQVNASLGWRPSTLDGVELRVWGKNLTDKKVIYGTTITTTADGVNYSPPRTYGVEVLYRF
jgi:iron complex outermembrane receptor protein